MVGLMLVAMLATSSGSNKAFEVEPAAVVDSSVSTPSSDDVVSCIDCENEYTQCIQGILLIAVMQVIIGKMLRHFWRCVSALKTLESA